MTDILISDSPQKQFDEFSPKRLLVLTGNTVRYIRSKWLWLVAAGLFFGILGLIMALRNKPLYTAELSFALDEGAVNSSTNNISQLSEELGFGTSYEAGGIFSNMTNILELIQSRLLIEKTLRRSVFIYGKPVLMADFFLDSLNFRSKWMKESKYEHVDFLKRDSAMDPEEIYRNGIFNNMYKVISSKLIKVDRKGKGATLILVTLTSENELFSKYFLEMLIDEVSRFYIDMKTYRSKLHLNFIQKRTDSVRDAYSNALYGRAVFTDANQNPNLQKNIVPGEKKQTDVTILRENYINLVKSLESAKTSLMEDTPLFQYLDMPVLPLQVLTGNKILKFTVFFIIGAVLMTTALLIFKFYTFLLSREQ